MRHRSSLICGNGLAPSPLVKLSAAISEVGWYVSLFPLLDIWCNRNALMLMWRVIHADQKSHFWADFPLNFGHFSRFSGQFFFSDFLCTFKVKTPSAWKLQSFVMGSFVLESLGLIRKQLWNLRAYLWRSPFSIACIGFVFEVIP